MKEYQTEQRKILLTFFQKNKERKLSVEEIMNELPKDINISLSAVYRNLDKMTKDGLLDRTLGADSNKAMYEYIECKSHCERIHLRCEKCGKIMHFDDEKTESTLTEMIEKTGFHLDGHATVLLGVCKDCKHE